MPNDYLPVPHQQQRNDGACLPACAVMVLRYLGLEADEAQLARLMRSYTIGTPARNVRYLTPLGVDVTFGSATLSDLQQNFLDHLPTIAFVNTEALPNHELEGYHAVVVVGLTEETVYLNDPAFETAPTAVPLDHFLLAWSDFDYLQATIMLIRG